MTTGEYDQLLTDLGRAWRILHEHQAQVKQAEENVEHLLRRLYQEEHRLAQSGLAHLPIASRKLVVGE